MLEPEIILFVSTSFSVHSRNQIAVWFKPHWYCFKSLSVTKKHTLLYFFFFLFLGTTVSGFDEVKSLRLFCSSASLMFLPSFLYWIYRSLHKATAITTFTIWSNFWPVLHILFLVTLIHLSFIQMKAPAAVIWVILWKHKNSSQLFSINVFFKLQLKLWLDVPSARKGTQKQRHDIVGARSITALTEEESFHHLWTLHYLLKLYGSRWD